MVIEQKPKCLPALEVEQAYMASLRLFTYPVVDGVKAKIAPQNTHVETTTDSVFASLQGILDQPKIESKKKKT